MNTAKAERDAKLARVHKELANDDELQRLESAVVEAAKVWNATPDDYISKTYKPDYEVAQMALGDAVDALIQFEQEHKS